MRCLVRCLLPALACCSLAAISLPTTTSLAARSAEDDLQDLLRDFDAQVQKRFLDSSKGFGMGRVYYPRHKSDGTMHRFTPENELEQQSIDRLERHGLDAVLYLGNPSLLALDSESPEGALADERSREDSARFLMGGFRVRPALQGPVTLTSSARSKRQPLAPIALLSDARDAFVAAGQHASVRFSRGGWDFVARPVRAVNERCVHCHNTSSEARGTATTAPQPYVVGDMLGVILYGTRAR